MRPIEEQVVVITGASSGIGRESALRFAQRGARLVIAARNMRALREVAREIEAQGGQAHAVETDVSDWDQQRNLAREAVERFGRIDTWVNNAAIGIYATAIDTPVDEIQQVIRVNLLGQIYGMKAVLPHMIERGEGTIVNVGSVESERAMPYHSAYAAAKHGVKGFADALRVELARDHPGIKVSSILPGSINTPFFYHSRARLGGVKPLPMPPIYEPGIVADAILFAAERPQARIYVGSSARTLSLLNRLSPALVDRMMLAGNMGFRLQETKDPDDGVDNLFRPLNEPGSVHGEYGKLAKPTSMYTELLELHPERKPLVAAAMLAALLLLLRGGRARR